MMIEKEVDAAVESILRNLKLDLSDVTRRSSFLTRRELIVSTTELGVQLAGLMRHPDHLGPEGVSSPDTQLEFGIACATIPNAEDGSVVTFSDLVVGKLNESLPLTLTKDGSPIVMVLKSCHRETGSSWIKLRVVW